MVCLQAMTETSKNSSKPVVSSRHVVSPVTGKPIPLPQNDILGASRRVSDFEKLNRVGEGTYGIVYRARDLKSREIVALKKIRMDREKEGINMEAQDGCHCMLSQTLLCLVCVPILRVHVHVR